MNKTSYLDSDYFNQDEEWNRDRPTSRVFRNVMLISRFYEDAIDQTAKQNGLQSGEFLVLMTLMRAGGEEGLRPTELYNELLVTSGAITKRVDRLSEMGLIERINSTSDRRSSPIKLTAKGKAKGEAIRNQTNKLHAVAEKFGSEALFELDEMLRKYLLAVETVTTNEDS